MLNKSKVKSRGIGDRLKVIGDLRGSTSGQVFVGSRNRRMLAFTQAGNSLSERAAEIGVNGSAPIPRPPTGIDGEPHQVCEPSNLLRPCRFATRQGAKLIQIDRVCPLKSQERIIIMNVKCVNSSSVLSCRCCRGCTGAYPYRVFEAPGCRVCSRFARVLLGLGFLRVRCTAAIDRSPSGAKRAGPLVKLDAHRCRGSRYHTVFEKRASVDD